MSEWDPNAFLRNVAEEVARVSEPPRGKEHKQHQKPNGSTNKTAGVSIDDFYAYMPMRSYIFAPTGDMWPAGNINQLIALCWFTTGRCRRKPHDHHPRVGFSGITPPQSRGITEENGTMTDDAAARIADGFWNDVHPATDTPDDMVEALTIVLAQALSLICPCCREDVLLDLRQRMPDILVEAERIAAEPSPAEHVQ